MATGVLIFFPLPGKCVDFRASGSSAFPLLVNFRRFFPITHARSSRCGQRNEMFSPPSSPFANNRGDISLLRTRTRGTNKTTQHCHFCKITSKPCYSPHTLSTELTPAGSTDEVVDNEHIPGVQERICIEMSKNGNEWRSDTLCVRRGGQCFHSKNIHHILLCCLSVS